MSFRFGSVVAAIAVALLMVCPATGQAGVAPAVEQCLQGTDKLSVVLLVDGSKSLKTFDPDDNRVDGIKAILAALSRATKDPSTGTEIDIEVLMASFYGDTKPKPNQTVGGKSWDTLTTDSVRTLLQKAELYEDQDSAANTDYAYALSNAQELLAQRSADLTTGGGKAPCGLIVFFTDGEYLVTDRVKESSRLPTKVPYAPGIDLSQPGAGAEAMKVGRQELCRPGGLIDQLNKGGTVLLTVALSTDISQANESFLKSLSGAGGDDCGSVKSLGDYVKTEAGSKLFFTFSDSLSGRKSSLKPLRPCSGPRCAEGGNDFFTLGWERGFQLLADTGSKGQGIRFFSPDGESIEIPSGDSKEVKAGGVTFKPLWVSDSTVDLTAEFDTATDDWIGDWNVALSSARSKSDGALHSLTFQTNLSPNLETEPTLLRGVPTEVTFQLTDTDGEAIKTSLVEDIISRAKPSASLSVPPLGTDEDLQVAGPTQELRLETETDLPANESSSTAEIGLTLEFDSRGGHVIDPVFQPFSFSSKLPDDKGYPDLEPTELNLPSITGVGSSSGEVSVTGTRGDGGCVWLDLTDTGFDAPGDSGEVAVKTEPRAISENDCIAVAEGETKTLKLTFTPADEASGVVNATLNFSLKSSISDVTEVETTSISASFPVAKEPNVAARLLILIALVVGGALLPILLLHLLNRTGAKLSAPQGIQYLHQNIEVDLAAGTIKAVGEGKAGLKVDTNYGSFRPVNTSGAQRREREITVGSLEFRAIASFSRSPKAFSLIPGPFGVVRASDGKQIVAGSQVPLRSWDANTWHEVPLDLPGTWVFTVDRFLTDAEDPALESDGELRGVLGELTLFITYGGSTDQGERLFESAQRRLTNFGWIKLAEAPVEKAPNGDGPISRLRQKFSKKTPPRKPERNPEYGSDPHSEEISNDPWGSDDWEGLSQPDDPSGSSPPGKAKQPDPWDDDDW